MNKEVVLPELPPCDVCVAFNEEPQPATGDSVLRLPDANRDVWGYSCDKHAEYRVGMVTTLVKEER